MGYRAPVDDIMLALKSAAEFDRLAAVGVYAGLDDGTVRQILDEAGRFAADVLDPLNSTGDRTGSRLVDGRVVTPAGWAEAYRAFVDAGWNALPGAEAYGGQGLPSAVASAVAEVWNAANLSFGLCPLLTQGAIDALEATGSPELKRLYLPRLVSGEWTGTMNLTEPQAGSDLAALTTRAERHPDGTYRLFGTKIYITYGEHDLAPNIVHFVLARLPDAPPGTKGISLFLVPKLLVAPDGTLGERNDVLCAGVEHKLGIHASPTCTMKYGESGTGAVGWLVGEENKGLAAMFIMMNAARLAVGVQGVAVAERATQRATAYARERRQGRTHWNPGGGMAAIIEHPDVRRNVILMRALTMAARGICLATAAALDVAERSQSPDERAEAGKRAALLTPVAKAWSTDIGVEVASLGIQVHGGMGFVEETGAAQHFRDSRILPIYEGTNGIQAIDLAMRKVPLDGGHVVKAFIGELRNTADEIRKLNVPAFGRTGELLDEATDALDRATDWLLARHAARTSVDTEAILAGATPYLELFGIAAGGAFVARAALAAHASGGEMAEDAVSVARFFAKNVAVKAAAVARIVTESSDALMALPAERLPA